MGIHLIEGLHLTATNKRHIADMMKRGMTEGGTARLRYVITNINGDLVRLTISKKGTNDRGLTVWRKGHYLVKVIA